MFDVLPRPPSARDLEALIANAREQAALAPRRRPRQHSRAVTFGIVGTSAAMRLVMDLVQRAASRPVRHPDLRRARHAAAR